ncbi:MAG TPA: bifunctional phosphopantothenoylcysteine decarboxylase/phosphopantothenate--cysteine ligase CoaBC [Marinagarivorans sp.]
MNKLDNKNILLGITGGIAAYKCAELTRLLKKQGANVQVVMTPAAEAFITPLTLQAVSGNPVRTQLLDPTAEAGMGHIELARWADLVVVAPASADFLARVVHGFANDLLTTICLATEAPIALAPAMNQAMWHNPITQANLAKIATYPHFLLWGPATGEQACGDNGQGRMLEPHALTDCVVQWAGVSITVTPSHSGPLAGKKVVITAGPTREAIDPVRYLSNQSSGKMGFALAEAAASAGAQVTLICGPTQQVAPSNITRIDVVSAQEMHAASLDAARQCDIFIGAAAVADFRPHTVAKQKIKKGAAASMQIELIKNPDIVADVAQLNPKPWVVGFAAETHDVIGYAKSKLQRKGLDMIIANDVSDPSIGFNGDNNAVTVIYNNASSDAEPRSLPENTKQALAAQLISLIAQAIPNRAPLNITSL